MSSNNRTSVGYVSPMSPISGYSPLAPVSAITPASYSRKTGVTGVADYTGLAQAADKERMAIAQRAAERQGAVIGGYDQQIANNRLMGDRGYQTLQGNYDAIAADAEATRARNMGRIDQYGNSMRSDLDIKARQAMAAANQSAIQRGLGNTTITNSLQRGAAFDNNRQKLALEDQLLQNRISTDANLSNAYQGTLQNRAQALGSQWNQNMANENQLTSQRLGYIGGIQENMDGFNSVANLYSQQFQQQQREKELMAENPRYGQPPIDYSRLGKYTWGGLR